MFIAHMPAGFIFSHYFATKLASKGISSAYIIPIGILGAVAPDLDLLYFYFIDNEQHNHHTYWTHFPILWISLLILFSVWFAWGKKPTIALLGWVFSANGLIHMLLDSVVGGILWFAPLLDTSFSLFTVPTVYTPWWLNFIFHWSFTFELVILSWAIIHWYENGFVLKKEEDQGY